MNVEIIAEALQAVVVQHHSVVEREAHEIYKHHHVPLIRSGKAAESHHDQPRDKAFVQIEKVWTFADGFAGH